VPPSLLAKPKFRISSSQTQPKTRRQSLLQNQCFVEDLFAQAGDLNEAKGVEAKGVRDISDFSPFFPVDRSRH
jgi:hypothetical protein